MQRRLFLGMIAVLPFATGARAATAHDFTFEAIEGGPLPLSRFAGRPVLVVNTASFCGYTPQYTALQALYDRYRDRGLVVLGVPSDDFGGQEYDTAGQVEEFCEVNFSIDFPMTDITRVRGSAAHPFYVWAREVLGARSAPSWNFHKYLIGPDGQAVTAFGTRIKPDAREITDAIEDLLR